ncbi:hypothetical protein [Romboutsia timonensis]|uniref:hypothetical protein n=1 Tax=Romboutsia timonensis TaxID=1776391 RepID=UPI0008D910ED|nr:hypothetical protein [Romboutsia timonensis]
MLDVFDIIDLDMESVKEYKKHIVYRYFNTAHYDIKYKEVIAYNKTLDCCELESYYPNITLNELDLDNNSTHKLDFIRFNFNTKEDIKAYIKKINKFIDENISSDFLNDISYIENEFREYTNEFLDRSSKYIIALSLKENKDWEHILYKKYFELDNKTEYLKN